jgi:hypothetical protein
MISYEDWLQNIRQVLSAIADRQAQETRWLALDAHAWERPEELINQVDDLVFDGFVTEFGAQFEPGQKQAASQFQTSLRFFCDHTKTSLDPAATLKDQRWQAVRNAAEQFLVAFSDRQTITLAHRHKRDLS